LTRRLLAAALLAAACGGSGGAPPPTDPGPAAPALPGGTINGKYLLRIEPARECAPPRNVLTFRMDGRPDNTGLRPGVQVALEYNPFVEIELQYAPPQLQGNIATSYDSASPVDAPTVAVWMYGTMAGTVTHAGDGPGEVLDGTMIGHIAFGNLDAPCYSTAHRWTLETR
jgi:hypothetical protein